MPLNNDNIYRYNFTSKSNKSWNFQLQFLRGSDDLVGTYDSSYLPAIFGENISILSDLPDELPFGKAKASLLSIDIDFTNLEGDFLVLKDWIMNGGQVISNVFYPNQFRILSNNGRGASDATYNIIEFWGCQDVIPEQEYSFEFGKKQTFELKVFSIENYILNKITEFSMMSVFMDTFDDILYYFRFTGTNTSSQSVTLFAEDSSAIIGGNLKLLTPTLINNYLVNQIGVMADTYLRNWLFQDTSIANEGLAGADNTFLQHWDFNKQLYDLTTQEGAGLGSNTEIKMIGLINNGSTNIGGLANNRSNDGFYQFKNTNDLLNSLSEQFINKLTFKYNRNDTLNSERIILQFNAPFDSIDGGSISITADNIIGVSTLKRGYFTINESTVSYKAYKENQNKNTYKNYGSLKQDSYDNKALFNTNLQIAELGNWNSAQRYFLPPMQINQLYYIRDDGFLFLTHANCSVDLMTEGTPITIANESTTGDTIDPADNLSSENKEINRAKLIEWSNKRYNKSGLSYVQSKAYSNIMNDKAMLLEFETADYIVRPKDLGQIINLDVETITDFPSDWFISNNHILVSSEIDLLSGISKNKIFIRGI